MTVPTEDCNSAPAEVARPSPAPAALTESWLRLLVQPGSVVELRALGCGKYGGVSVGYFDGDHLDAMAREASRLTLDAVGVYFTLNPLNRALIARAANRVRAAKRGESAADEDVLRRRLLLIDVDPKRPKGISATDEEKAAAWVVMRSVLAHLAAQGWPAPIVSDSGNGGHAFYSIDLPAKDENLLKRVLHALAARFDTPAATIDRAVHNPARICKIAGTLARKGDSQPDRPHRASAVLEVPGCTDPTDPTQLAQVRVEVVSRELLELVAGDVKESPPLRPANPPRPSGTTSPSGTGHRLKVGEWLTDRGVEYQVEPDGESDKYILVCCPFNPEHAGKDAAIFQRGSGSLGFHCFHASCSGHGWQEAKRQIGPPEPHHYDPPLTRSGRCAWPNTRPEVQGPPSSSAGRG